MLIKLQNNFQIKKKSFPCQKYLKNISIHSKLHSKIYIHNKSYIQKCIKKHFFRYIGTHYEEIVFIINHLKLAVEKKVFDEYTI